MLQKTKNILLITMAITAIVIIFTQNASAWTHQEKYKNRMSVPAKDLTKILKGDINVTRAIHHKFRRYRVRHPGGRYTTIHWDNGTVNPGQSTWACFNVHPRNQAVRVLCALWTDSNRRFIGVAGGTITILPNRYNLANIQVDIEHSWRQWDAEYYDPNDANDYLGEPEGPIDVNNVFWHVGDTLYPEECLNDELIDSLDWIAGPNTTLTYGDVNTYDLGPLSEDQVVIFRATTNADCNDMSGETYRASTIEMIQFSVGDEYNETAAPPTLTGDLNRDCTVNFLDMAELAGNWLIDAGETLDPNWPLE